VEHKNNKPKTPVFAAVMRGDTVAVSPPDIFNAAHPYQPLIPLHTLRGVFQRHKNVRVRTYPFSTNDGLGLSLTRFTTRPCNNVIVIMHGLTTSSDMFIMPEHNNLVSYLLDNGYTDVWCLDSRLSNRFPYNLLRHRYTLDDVARFDIPAAMSLVRGKTDAQAAVHVIAHCLGSLAFMMSLYGKQINGIQSVISNSISLHPKTPLMSLIKLTLFPFAVDYVLGMRYVNPNAGFEPGFTISKFVARLVDMIHRECDCRACHMLSFMWGSGFPALFEHGNMDPITHRRLGDLFGATSVHYYRHVRKMVLAKKAVQYAKRKRAHATLPYDYMTYAKEIATPVLFVAGGNNRVFCDSNKVSYQILRNIGMNQHEFHEFEKYGHQDIFMGKNVDVDIFPTLLRFLKKHKAP
jgi:hypothetical protein